MKILEKARSDGATIYLKTAGINIFSVERDLNAITSEIGSEEKIYIIAAGKLAQISNDRLMGIGGPGYTGTDTKGVAVITDKKVLFMDKRVFGKQSIVIEGDRISSVERAEGIISAKVIIHSFGNKYDITDLKKEAATEMIAAIEKLRVASKRKMHGKTHSSVSGMDEIRKAKSMFDDGIISREEFEKIKSKHM